MRALRARVAALPRPSSLGTRISVMRMRGRSLNVSSSALTPSSVNSTTYPASSSR